MPKKDRVQFEKSQSQKKLSRKQLEKRLKKLEKELIEEKTKSKNLKEVAKLCSECNESYKNCQYSSIVNFKCCSCAGRIIDITNDEKTFYGEEIEMRCQDCSLSCDNCGIVEGSETNQCNSLIVMYSKDWYSPWSRDEDIFAKVLCCGCANEALHLAYNANTDCCESCKDRLSKKNCIHCNNYQVCPDSLEIFESLRVPFSYQQLACCWCFLGKAPEVGLPTETSKLMTQLKNSITKKFVSKPIKQKSEDYTDVAILENGKVVDWLGNYPC